ncbi:Uncharacterised protein [Streptococcus criceti]|uniref:Uncharacterized protein n=1 Tax=Streptococcus criceti HS-6 TaxID=873449 RepID=G5JRV0_STRCG|nr:hypothetical protein [Streptococcus criceti]EHI75240.1 hypothetical protein STRCR_0808 [Streptococcus criceti HS-6]SUN43664.1 Uncharacterised protein [Streptococcus criceti]
MNSILLDSNVYTDFKTVEGEELATISGGEVTTDTLKADVVGTIAGGVGTVATLECPPAAAIAGIGTVIMLHKTICDTMMYLYEKFVY